MQSAETRKTGQFIIVVGILLVAAGIAVLLFLFKPVAERAPAPYEPPPVRYMVARTAEVSIPVKSQGTIEPRAEINLSAEVPGRISEISESLNDGEFFKQGELLARIDDSDYRLAITKAEATVAAARQALARVEAEAEQARFDIQRMGRDLEQSSAYALREPHLKEARANLKAARADLAIARLQLERTRVRAPFDGRVVEKRIDVGEYVSPGMTLARIYSSRRMQVKLPLTQRQLNLIDLSVQQDSPSETGSKVLLETDFAGKHLQWQARLTGLESRVDPRNRMLNAIAEIDSGTTLRQPDGALVSTAGLFVSATIEGRSIGGVFVIPRLALRNGNEVWLLNDAQLDIKKVSVLHKDDNTVYIDRGLSPGDRVITSALDYAIQGMKLSAVE